MSDDRIAAVRATLAHLTADLPRLIAESTATAGAVAEATFDGYAGDERGSATVTGLGEVTAVTIGELARRDLDNLTLGDLVTEAVLAAEATARRAMAERMGALSVGGRSLAAFLPAAYTADGTLP